MKNYNYIALNAQGEEVSGVVSAEDEGGAITELRKVGNYPIKITEADQNSVESVDSEIVELEEKLKELKKKKKAANSPILPLDKWDDAAKISRFDAMWNSALSMFNDVVVDDDTEHYAFEEFMEILVADPPKRLAFWSEYNERAERHEL